MESISISPSSNWYRLPTRTRGLSHTRTVRVMAPLRTPSRRYFVNNTVRVYRHSLSRTERGVHLLSPVRNNVRSRRRSRESQRRGNRTASGGPCLETVRLPLYARLD